MTADPVPTAHSPGTEARLGRLAAIQLADPGLFVLAVHAFVEAWLGECLPRADPGEEGFCARLDSFARLLEESSRDRLRPVPAAFSLLARSHGTTHEVRHRFAPLAVEEARQATWHLLAFCDRAGIHAAAALGRMREHLAAWDERRPAEGLAGFLRTAGYPLATGRGESARIARDRADLEDEERKYRALRRRYGLLEARLEDLRTIPDGHDETIEGLASERAMLADRLAESRERLGDLADARRRLDALLRLSVHARTRRDYDRSVMRPSPEQREALERIRLDGDFLLKGGAGTGKTAVLLEAMRAASGGGLLQGAFDLPGLGVSAILLTYTNTLVKHDRYLAASTTGGGIRGRVCTADTFLLERLRELDPSLSIEFDLPEALARRFPVEGMAERELAAEVELFIWGNDIAYEEYVERGVERRGMRRPLAREQRASVWNVVGAMEAWMREHRTWTRNRAALHLARALASQPAPGVTRTDIILVDEAQDLPAVVLRAIKACSARAVVLAGDSDQSIYQPGFSFRRAGFDVAGRTRVLRTNFRNTLQIHAVAERYRAATGGADPETMPEAYRDGPEPELFEGADEQELLDLLARSVGIFVDRLGYAPEDLCVLAPRESHLRAVGARLSREGRTSADIRDRDFDFGRAGSVRLSTMHSAKGLDFPVVLLYVPEFHPGHGALHVGTEDRMARNLVYTAVSRTMDCLAVFVPAGELHPTIGDLAACMTPGEA